MKRTVFNAFRAVASFAAAGFISLAAVSCGDGDKSETEKSLKVNTSEVTLEADGTSSLVEVSSKGVAWTATVADEWLHVDKTSGTESTFVKVSADVNTEATERKSSVTFSADGVPSVSVTVSQNGGGSSDGEPALNQDKTMQYAEFAYYGDVFNSNGQYEIVSVVLVDKEVSDEGTVELPFDNVLFAIALPYKGSANAIVNSVFGTFNCLSASAATLPCILNEASAYSYVYGQGEDDSYTYNVTSGTVTVASTSDKKVKIDFDVTLEGGRTYKGTYTGSPSFYDETQDDGDGYYTNLESDYTPTLTSAKAVVGKLVDNNKNEITSVAAALVQMQGVATDGATDVVGFYMYIDYADFASKDLTGKYNCTPENAKTYSEVLNTFEPGEITVNADNEASISPSIFYSASGGSLVKYAVLEAGSVTFTKKSGDSYSVVMDCKDREGHAIKGSYTLDMPVTEYKEDAASVSALSASAYSVRIADFTTSAMPVQKGKSLFSSRLF